MHNKILSCSKTAKV